MRVRSVSNSLSEVSMVRARAVTSRRSRSSWRARASPISLAIPSSPTPVPLAAHVIEIAAKRDSFSRCTSMIRRPTSALAPSLIARSLW